jgi:hypothetical protein
LNHKEFSLRENRSVETRQTLADIYGHAMPYETEKGQTLADPQRLFSN